MHKLHPDDGEHKPYYPHHGKDMFPAQREGQPAEQRREQSQREVLSGIKDSLSSTKLCGRKPGRHNAGVGGKRGRFGKAQHKTHKEHGDPGPGEREHINKALQEGKQ